MTPDPRNDLRRSAWNDRSAPFLVGNAEIGGLVHPLGTGLRTLWGAGLWQSEADRLGLAGPALEPVGWDADQGCPAFSQLQFLADGTVRTEARLADGAAYAATLRCDAARSGLVVLELRTSGRGAWNLRLPTAGCRVRSCDRQVLEGVSHAGAFTPFAWCLRSSRPLTEVDGRWRLEPEPGSTVELRFAVTTAGDGHDHPARARRQAGDGSDPADLLAAHRQAWAATWAGIASIRLGDPGWQALLERCCLWLAMQSGAQRFLPGETMFADDPVWNMRPFTYGGAGWSAMAWSALGDARRARRILANHLVPGSLAGNARLFLPGDPGDAWCFPHEGTWDGRCLHDHNPYYRAFPYHRQRHLDGFAAAMFAQAEDLAPDPLFREHSLWPVLRGTASFWERLAVAVPGGHGLPDLLSLSEDLVAPSVLDAVLAARGTLEAAADCADRLGREAGRAQRWRALAASLVVPRQGGLYREFAGDDGSRAGGGYFGVRAPAWLGWPWTGLGVDREDAGRTLDATWERNRGGQGMISFVASWFALCELHLGRGERALRALARNRACLDPCGQVLCETDHADNPRPYYLASVAGVPLACAAMLVQSHRDGIRVCPAVPAGLGDIEFTDLPTSGGARVSGAWRDGRLAWATVSVAGEERVRLDQARTVARRELDG